MVDTVEETQTDPTEASDFISYRRAKAARETEHSQ